MDATPSPLGVGPRRPWAVRPWTFVTLALLLVVATLIQACSDNSGTTGPTFSCNESPIEQGTTSAKARALAACTGGTQGPVPVVGNIGGGLTINVQVNPGTIDIGRRASVIVIVTSGTGGDVGKAGAGIPGRTVRLDAVGGNLDATSGTTDANGVFSTTMIVPCGSVLGAGLVTAIVDGVKGSTIFISQPAAAGNDPCA